MTTTVINIKDAPENWVGNPDYTYIGRKRAGLGGTWGNPFILENDTPSARTTVLDKYKLWLWAQDFWFRDTMYATLKDKILVCYCKPKLCHGDVIADYIDNYHLSM